ncbi:alpha/beta hydrolase [Flammeovirgaceae bacterium SG7u.111]|nr:alpha/beta hydrolase [Flammeovirgaceae bacterium SG7u.132]WPO34051.1 alpha/beta hydrolase [Flammeovirgaceae bacterium SG7u.111]
MTQKLLKILRFALLSPLFLALLTNGCMRLKTSDKKILAHFEEQGVAASVQKMAHDANELRYVETGAERNKENLLVFVHGAPGAGDDFFGFLTDSVLLEKARIVTVDRPGYGHSGYGKSVTSIQEQAIIIGKVLEEAKEDHIYLIGHSYGGPIVGKMATMYAVDGIMMLAPVNDPESEPIYWIAHLGKWKLTRWMASKPLRVATDEKFAHKAELALLKEDWGKITVPVVHLHGGKDFLAPFEGNVAWSKKYIKPKMLKLVEDPEMTHFIPWKNYGLVKKELLLLMEGE